MDRNEEIASAIKQRDAASIIRLMFDGNPPSLKKGFHTETVLWDFKGDCPKTGKEHINAWADIAKDVLAFHNKKGGILIFGISNTDYTFCGATVYLDSKLFNDKVRVFLGDALWVEYHREFIQPNQRYLGLALVPPKGIVLERFRKDAPEVRGRRLFHVGDSAIRKGDSSQILRKQEVDKVARETVAPKLGQNYAVDEPYYRILQPDYELFVERPEPCKAVLAALRDPRASIASVVGIGGVGKTALATWAVLKSYEERLFNFIVSVTAKDRELTRTGIMALSQNLTSFDELLNSVVDVLGFPELKTADTGKKESQVRELIQGENGLLYVDNLETVDDPRIIDFLDNLPVGVRAITTSRRVTVRVSVRPLDLYPLSQDEMPEFVRSLSSLPGFSYVSKLADAECISIGEACDGIPLAVRWVLARSSSAPEALSTAQSVTGTGKHGEELLEFCFRRAFDAMLGPEKSVLEVLSLFERPIMSEPIVVGSQVPHFRAMDAIEQLVADSLVQRFFDSDNNDYCYQLLPIVRAFVYGEVAKQPVLEERIRGKLTDWFEANDIGDSAERLVVREIRQGKGAAEAGLLDLAKAAERRGDVQSAEELYEQALQRNPNSWRAARLYAEFQRHMLSNRAKALSLYEQAAAFAPRRGVERARIFREWGMILRDAGTPGATDEAIDKFRTALLETPHDKVAIGALAQMLDRRGAYREIIELLEPIIGHPDEKTRSITYPLLLKAYERTGEVVKAAEFREKLSSL